MRSPEGTAFSVSNQKADGWHEPFELGSFDIRTFGHTFLPHHERKEVVSPSLAAVAWVA